MPDPSPRLSRRCGLFPRWMTSAMEALEVGGLEPSFPHHPSPHHPSHPHPPPHNSCPHRHRSPNEGGSSHWYGVKVIIVLPILLYSNHFETYVPILLTFTFSNLMVMPSPLTHLHTLTPSHIHILTHSHLMIMSSPLTHLHTLHTLTPHTLTPSHLGLFLLGQ